MIEPKQKRRDEGKVGYKRSKQNSCCMLRMENSRCVLVGVEAFGKEEGGWPNIISEKMSDEQKANGKTSISMRSKQCDTHINSTLKRETTKTNMLKTEILILSNIKSLIHQKLIHLHPSDTKFYSSLCTTFGPGLFFWL